MKSKPTYKDLVRELSELKKIKIGDNTSLLKGRIDSISTKEKILSLIYDNVEDVIYSLEVKGKDNYVFNSINNRFLQATGLLREQVIGQEVKNIIPEPSLSLVLEKYAEAIAKDEVIQWEETTQYPTGTKTGEVTIAPIFDEDHNCVLLVGSVHDITEHNRLEIELKKSIAAIERKNKELEQFTYITSHDLQEPLRTIISFTELLEQEYQNELDEKKKTYLNYILSSSIRMKKLIRGLLDYGRIGHKKTPTVVDCNELIKEVLHDISTIIADSNVELTIGKLPQLTGYKTELHVLFQNIISNAIKFQTKGKTPQIDISAEKENNHWKFAVADNGIGIKEENKEKIFKIFQRLNLRDKYEGDGIGLAQCSKIVEMHGGKIWVDSQLNLGSTFYITLPA